MFENLMLLITLVLFVVFHIIRTEKQARGQGQQAFTSFELEEQKPAFMNIEEAEEDSQKRMRIQAETGILVAEPRIPDSAMNTDLPPIPESSPQSAPLNTDAAELKRKKLFSDYLADLPALKQGILWREILGTPKGLQRDGL